MNALSKQYKDNPRVAALLRKGMPPRNQKDAKKAAAEFSRQDVPDLIRMGDDLDLFFSEEDDTTWAAPVHAWQILGNLRAPEATLPLLQILAYEWEHDESLDEWRSSEIRNALGLIGEPALEPTAAFMNDAGQGMWGRCCAADALKNMAQEYPELRDRAIAVLTDGLRGHASNGPIINGTIVGNLLELKGVEALDVIREAYAQRHVDLTMAGDIEDVEIELGVRSERSTTRRNYFREANPRLAEIADMRETLRDGEGTKAAGEPTVRTEKKVGRNDPCPCGSGKKYKKCCMNK